MDDLQRELNLYENGKIDELIELLDQPDRPVRKPPIAKGSYKDAPNQKNIPDSKPCSTNKGKNQSVVPKASPDSLLEKSLGKTSLTERNSEPLQRTSNAATRPPGTLLNGPIRSGSLVNGRFKRPYLANKQQEKHFDPKPVRGIDENWFLQKTEEGINVLEYTERLPLSVPNQDLFKLNSVRSAAKRALRSSNQRLGGTSKLAHGSSPKKKEQDTDTLNTHDDNKQYEEEQTLEVEETENDTSTADLDLETNSDSSYLPSHKTIQQDTIIRQDNLDEEKPAVNVNSMLQSGSELLGKVRNLLQSNIPIPINGLEGVEEENEANKPVVPEDKILELHQVQDKWLELDNEIKGIRSLIKDLQAKQRELSEYLKSEMLKYQIPHLKSLQGDKIILKSQNRKGTYKKDYIYTKLQEVLQDPEMAAKLSEHLENERPVSECINLSRTKK